MPRITPNILSRMQEDARDRYRFKTDETILNERGIAAIKVQVEARKEIEVALKKELTKKDRGRPRKKIFPFVKKESNVPILPDEPKPIVRPPAVYTNIPTPFGIATEMLMEQLKKSG